MRTQWRVEQYNLHNGELVAVYVLKDVDHFRRYMYVGHGLCSFTLTDTSLVITRMESVK